jgi:hypothetical protein
MVAMMGTVYFVSLVVMMVDRKVDAKETLMVC